jgi:hypothetical protein
VILSLRVFGLNCTHAQYAYTGSYREAQKEIIEILYRVMYLY